MPSLTGARTSKVAAGGGGLPERVTIDEASARYTGQWVLVRVSEFDASNLPAAGFVVAHGTDREMQKALQALPPLDDPETPYYLFSAYSRVRSGAAWRLALAQVATEGDVRVRRQP